jgi:hypothetical protein
VCFHGAFQSSAKVGAAMSVLQFTTTSCEL